MKREPESVRDMAWAAQQQAGNAVTIEHHDGGNEPSEGALSHAEVNVTAWEYKDEIEVCRSTYRYEEPLKTGGWSLEGEHETLARLSFEKFRASEWWEAYLAKTRGLNFDSSWMDSFRVDADEDFAAVSFYAPEYRSVWWCSSDVPTGDTVRCEVDVSSDGTVLMRFDGESEESTVSDFIEAVRRLRAFDEAGVSLDDEGNVIVRKTSERSE